MNHLHSCRTLSQPCRGRVGRQLAAPPGHPPAPCGSARQGPASSTIDSGREGRPETRQAGSSRSSGAQRCSSPGREKPRGWAFQHGNDTHYSAFTRLLSTLWGLSRKEGGTRCAGSTGADGYGTSCISRETASAADGNRWFILLLGCAGNAVATYTGAGCGTKQRRDGAGQGQGISATARCWCGWEGEKQPQRASLYGGKRAQRSLSALAGAPRMPAEGLRMPAEGLRMPAIPRQYPAQGSGAKGGSRAAKKRAEMVGQATSAAWGHGGGGMRGEAVLLRFQEP